MATLINLLSRVYEALVLDAWVCFLAEPSFFDHRYHLPFLVSDLV